jgi:hypothetical protein
MDQLLSFALNALGHFIKDVGCSAKCRGAIDTARAKELRALRRTGRECPHCKGKFTPKRIDARYCSISCRQSAYRLRLEAQTN